jgi:hypothetical protein
MISDHQHSIKNIRLFTLCEQAAFVIVSKKAGNLYKRLPAIIIDE